MEKFYKRDYLDSYILVFKFPLSHDYYENAQKKYFYLLKTEILEKYQDYYDFGKFSIDEIFIFLATWEKPTFWTPF